MIENFSYEDFFHWEFLYFSSPEVIILFSANSLLQLKVLSSAKWCKAFSAMVEYTLSIVTCILSQKKGDCFWFVELLFCSSKKITQKTTISQRLWRSSVEQHWCMERPQLKCASRSIIFLCLLNAHYGVFLIFCWKNG